MAEPQATLSTGSGDMMAKRHPMRLPTISSVSTADSNGSVPVCVRNTFIDLQIGRPPSLDEFFRERLTHSAPGSKIEEVVEASPKVICEEPQQAPVLLLAEALKLSGPTSSGAQKEQQYSIGSAGHGTGECHPCAFFWKDKGCSSGSDCNFCHMCGPGEKKRRQKEKRSVWRGIDRMRQAFFGPSPTVERTS
eukprot:gb/GFBE01054125.1/.p1 GENE.gb/GFBE01054125.1/~~gb/GFBE01054125.1/.p1  ORF type:complete len:192 (+),score=43.12 gb/GFBE01054125.1/:1-576(+)